MRNFNDEGDFRYIPKQASRAAENEDHLAPVQRKSPPTDRVVQILNLLANAPHEALTLTQVSARLDLNKPTCLGILTALTEADFVTRDQAKAYRLGPALLRLGSSAESGLAAVDLVRPLVEELHQRLGISCLLSAVHGDHIVVLDRLGPASTGNQRDVVGERYPFTPPLGLVNVAWEHDSIVDAWLSRTPLAPLPSTDTALHALIDHARDRGYIIECLTSAATTPNMVLSNLLASGLPAPIVEELRRHLPPVDWSEYSQTLPPPGATIPVANISAPILDRHGRQKYTLTLMPERTEVTADKCHEWATALLSTTEEATFALGGAAL
ncbi:IclR family transcriptional regulator [Rhodococcus sp. ARC_M6]|uniref:IclR family transcriptional regulator n=1 Tax=Rhodococcus sp. ARC_M6 TaxID=2928852 RepID=UPI001FB45421|nr:helix-turn-helix domain-containing protein [Rhodococcus sp. ARC_M6]MCJ0902448.1 helix-turn-helix domain-containing protein [Rhodococcus sp. ARC_M6]